MNRVSTTSSSKSKSNIMKKIQTYDRSLILSEEQEEKDTFNSLLTDNHDHHHNRSLDYMKMKIKSYPWILIFKNDIYEQLFVNFYYGKKLIRLKLILMLSTIMWASYISIDIYLYYINEFRYVSYFVICAIFRFLPVFILPILFGLLFLDCVKTRKKIVDIVSASALIIFFSCIMVIGVYSIRVNVFPIASPRVVITCFIAIFATRLRLIVNVICFILTVPLFCILLITAYVEEYSYKIIPTIVTLVVFGGLVLLQSSIVERTFRNLFLKRKSLEEIKNVIDSENTRRLKLLQNIFPSSFVDRLIVSKNDRFFCDYDSLGLILSDLVQFTKKTTEMGPQLMIEVLNAQIIAFDKLCERYELEKIKTIGDAYFCCDLKKVGTIECIKFAQDMIIHLQKVNLSYNVKFQVRIGITEGSASVVCLGEKLNFDVYGQSVERIRELEAHSTPNKILVCDKVREMTQSQVVFIENKSLDKTYYVVCLQNISVDENEDDVDSKKEIKELKYENIEGTSFTPTVFSTSISSIKSMKINRFTLTVDRREYLKYYKFSYEEFKNVLKIIHCVTSTTLLVFTISIVFYLYDFSSSFYSLIPLYVTSFLSVLVTLIYIFFSRNYFIGLFLSISQIILLTCYLFEIFFIKKELIVYSKFDEILPIVIVGIYFYFTNIPFAIISIYSFIVIVVFFIVDILCVGFLLEGITMWLMLLFFQMVALYPVHYSLLELYRTKLFLQREIKVLQKQVTQNDNILTSCLPHFVINRFKNNKLRFDKFSNGSVLFVKVIGLNFKNSKEEGKELIKSLNNIFCIFDKIVEKRKCIKIKSIFDTYIVIHQDSFEVLAQCSFDFIEHYQKANGKRNPLTIKCGISVGHIIGGIIGQRFLYDVFGDCVNTSSRMCDQSKENDLLTSCDINFLKQFEKSFEFIATEKPLSVKGKGTFTAYWIRKIIRNDDINYNFHQ